jgi:hypothetical protein
MQFERLHISNFRGISSFEIENLATMVVVAGPNGCGKSSVFDAIRLLKSVYGGYQQDEVRSWFGEFQINLSRRDDVMRVFRDPTRDVEIWADLVLSDSEIQYLSENAEPILEPLVWQEVLGREIDLNAYGSPALATDLRVHGETVRSLLNAAVEDLRQALTAQEMLRARLVIDTALNVVVDPNRVLEVLFRTFDPHHLGIIDYHGPTRTYQRETVGGLTLSLESAEQRRRQHSLYNYQSKYSNVKTELAASYVRDLITREAGIVADASGNSLNQTLVELFQTFFPDKTYEGPRPTAEGIPEFPIRLSSGEEHDIDDLSSGEKEVLYGYLRLRDSAPQKSIVLIDEPELHLNPGLLQGFPDFYHRHLGRALGNQLWLVTHSDALLRQSVGNRNFAVFHMRAATATPAGENQALPIHAEDDELERAIIDLVGDLATYKPHAKVVILEGAEAEFDRLMVSRLFPRFAQRVNILSGGSRRRVEDLYEMLAEASATTGLGDRFYAIVDRDSTPLETPADARILQWDRYHIENYLLEPPYVLAALQAVQTTVALESEKEVASALAASAETLVNRLVLQELEKTANRQLVSAIDVGAPRNAEDPAAELRPSIEGSARRLTEAAARLLDGDYLDTAAESVTAELNGALESGDWLRRFPGRAVLTGFVATHVPGVSYENFRNLVIDQMIDDGFQPQGMTDVIGAIEAS